MVESYATIERLNLAVRLASSEPDEKVSMKNYLVLIDVIENACRSSLPLLSDLPVDERDADIKEQIAKWKRDHADNQPHP